MLGPVLWHQILDLEATVAEPSTEQLRTRLIRFTGRIDGRDPHERRGKIDDFVGSPLDLGQNPCDWRWLHYP